MIIIICSTFLMYKDKIDDGTFVLLALLGGLSEFMIELLMLLAVLGK